MELITLTLTRIAYCVPEILLGIFLLVLGNLMYQKTNNSFRNFGAEIKDRKNIAFAINLSGYLLGLAIALLPNFTDGNSTPTSLAQMALFGVMAMVLIRASMVINDKWILSSFSNNAQLQENNVAVGFVQAGSSIATGLVLSGVFTGSSAGFGTMIRDIVIYWITSQILLVVAGELFERLNQLSSKIKVEELLKRSQSAEDIQAGIAMSVAYFGWLCAVGIIVRAAVSGAGSDVLTELMITLMQAGFGLMILTLALLFLDRAFVGNVSLSREISNGKNIAAASVMAVVLISIALFIGVKVTVPTVQASSPTVQVSYQLEKSEPNVPAKIEAKPAASVPTNAVTNPTKATVSVTK